MARIFSPITKFAQAVASGGGTATFTISESPPFDTLWRGTAWIETGGNTPGPAPAAASTNVTAGGESWGWTSGGAGLFVEAKATDQIVATSSGLTPGATYVLKFKGNALLEEFAASEVGYLSPFPSSQH